MTTCGEYELERAIGWGRHATFYSACAASRRGPSLIVIRRARTGERAYSQAFLRSAAEQQAAVGAGCRRLAPILTFEHDESGFAFYATTRYETSLAEFIEAGCKVDSPLLREIVTSVLGALAELHDKSRRGHGKLTAGNILLDPQGRIFLTDLAPTAKDATTAGDLFALGTVIYQLVRRTARIGMLNPPLDYSQEWTESLGDDAEGWLAFTNRLLDKPCNGTPDAIKSALGNLKSLAGLAAKAAASVRESSGGGTPIAVRKPPPKKKSTLPALLAIVLVLAGGGGGYVWWKKQEAEKQRQVEIALAKAAQIERDKTLPGAIKNLRDELKQLPPEISGDGTLRSILGRIGQSLGGTATKDQIISEFGGLLKNWELPGRMNAQADAWRTAPREWTRLAGELDESAKVDPENDTSVVTQLQKTIATHAAADKLEREWSEITFILKDLAAAKNRLLPDFTLWAASEIRGARDFADASSRAGGALKTLEDIRDFQRNKWVRVVQQRFEKEAADLLKTPSEDRMPGWPRNWKREAERLVGPTDEKRAEWNKVLERAGARIPKLPAKDQPGWQQKLADARAASDAALETDAAAIERRLTEFSGLRLPIEIAHEQYERFLQQWKIDAAGADTKKAADLVLARYRAETGKLLPEYQAKIDSKGLAKVMAEKLALPDKISIIFSRPDDWDLMSSDPGAAIYRFRKAVAVPFLALGTSGFAMSAIEIPLSLARLSGAGGSPPGTGPTIRGADFSPDAANKWLWKQPLDFIRGQGIADYFAAGVSPGDVGFDTCPVTWLSFAEASAMAKALGGALPTAAQWTEAAKHPGTARRLRSGAWTAQVSQVMQWNTTFQVATRAFLPDTGSFSKQTGLAGNLGYLSDIASAPNATGDNSVWLKSVFPPGGWKPSDGFYHIVGNAAEWVDANGKPAVIGGSIVSPPSLPINAPIPIRTGAGAFDVTFRLVVKLGPGGAGLGLEEFKKTAAGITLPPAADFQ
ncbi:MAG: hypothetical protein ABI318_14315 [Chthoniobacteraceae bacterium]